MTWRIIWTRKQWKLFRVIESECRLDSLFGFSVDDNPEPRNNWIRWVIIVDEEPIRSYDVPCYLKIPWGNTRRQTKVEVGLGYCSIEDKRLNLPEKWDQRRTYGRNHDCKDQFTGTKWYYIKGIVIITRSFHDRIYIVSMGMNTSSRSTPTSSVYNLSFTSLFRRSCRVELSGKIPDDYDSWKLSSSHIIWKA